MRVAVGLAELDRARGSRDREYGYTGSHQEKCGPLHLPTSVGGVADPLHHSFRWGFAIFR